jgi:hypothetical protein
LWLSLSLSLSQLHGLLLLQRLLLMSVHKLHQLGQRLLLLLLVLLLLLLYSKRLRSL